MDLSWQLIKKVCVRLERYPFVSPTACASCFCSSFVTKRTYCFRQSFRLELIVCQSLRIGCSFIILSSCPAQIFVSCCQNLCHRRQCWGCHDPRFWDGGRGNSVKYHYHIL